MSYQPKFGWAGQYKESKAFEYVAEHGDVFVEPDEFQKARDTFAKSQVDKLIKQMPFDEGFAFWASELACFGSPIPPGPQDCGDCVAYSDVLAMIDRLCFESFCLGESDVPETFYVPFSYGTSRVYVGGNRIRGDGSTGAWSAQAAKTYGYLPTNVEGLRIKASEPLEPDAATTRRFGSSKQEHDKWKDHAEPFKIKNAARVRTAEEAKEMVTVHHLPLTIASGQGFVKRGFDSKYGITLWRPGGAWAHQMRIRGIFSIKGSWFVYVGNQWGANYHGKVGDGFPLGGFVITFEDFARWVPRANVYVRGGMQGRTAPYVPMYV